MKKALLALVPFVLVFLFVFRSLLFNMSTNLIDWFDYPYIVWTVYQNIDKISSLNFPGFFNTNAFYPYENTLFFSDLLIPQSLIAYLFSLFSDNPILVFNLLFIATFILNYFSTYLFWSTLFKKEIAVIVGSMITVFSPFFHQELGHFQMMSFWPMFFSLYFLFKDNENKTKDYLNTGIFITVQFLASAYLSIFLVTTIAVYFCVKLISYKNYKRLARDVIFIGIPFLITSGFFIKGYFDTQNGYKIRRDYGEYIVYSAHLSDYIFSNNINSIIHRSPLITNWNKFNNHLGGASFPGFTLSIIGFMGIVSAKKRRSKLSLSFSTKVLDITFLSLILIGLVFSLGPRMNFNGSYAYIPLPYHFIVKYVPFISSVRATVRWSFLLYLGLIYYVTKFLNKRITTKSYWIVIIMLLIVEYIPINISTTHKNYLDNTDKVLSRACSNAVYPVLEIPVTHLSAQGGLHEGLSYITTNLLASTKNDCKLINGYSGYDMPHLLEIGTRMQSAIANKDPDGVVDIIKESHAKIVVFNRERISEDITFITELDNERLKELNLDTPIEDNVTYYLIN